MIVDKIIASQAVDVRNLFDKTNSLISKSPIPPELDPLLFDFPHGYAPPKFPLPSMEWTREEWPHCGFDAAEEVKGAYAAFSARKNTQNALFLAALGVIQFNWFLAAGWYQLAALNGNSSIAMAELVGILLRGLDVDRNEEAAAYWYHKSGRVISGLLLQEPRLYALNLAGKTLMRLEVTRKFTDPRNFNTFQFFGRPEQKLLSIQIHPNDLEGEYKWSHPRFVSSTPPGSECYESRAVADAYFDIGTYAEAEQRLRSKSRI